MGARLYIPTLSRFLQVDPVEGGTDNNYAYANDPVNQFDLDGQAIPLVFIAANLARMAAPHVARFVTQKAAPLLIKKAVPQMARVATNVAARAWNKAKVVMNDNPILRIGHGRVSTGQAPSHYRKMGPVGRLLNPVSTHFERSKGIITFNWLRKPSGGYRHLRIW